ncbi:hypothetical protein SLS56_004000 [Neofusicoccum ribis]|uniref:DUF6594 domain-containing protein n=1 Tax=Neofusicoccum ribis TaxID=45134 RepID=A0ABR3SYE3_9PEZI
MPSLYRELARDSPQQAAATMDSPGGDEDHYLQKLMAQEEQLRRHMLRSPTHHHARDEPHYAHNDAADSPRGPTVFPYYYYSDSSSQPQPGPYWGHPDPPPPPAPHVPVSDPSYHAAAQPYGQFPPPSPHGRIGGGGQLQSGAPDLSKMTITGYEKLAFALAEKSTRHDANAAEVERGAHSRRSIRPLYRRFEYLNHRILLHIQDELAELEEELRELDECIAQQQDTASGEAQPASRRLESRYGSDLHARRTLLLGNIYSKLGQYSRASL